MREYRRRERRRKRKKKRKKKKKEKRRRENKDNKRKRGIYKVLPDNRLAKGREDFEWKIQWMVEGGLRRRRVVCYGFSRCLRDGHVQDSSSLVDESSGRWEKKKQEEEE
ncbi:hypothetical protein V1478_009671 [Vespula squamosa]|uniref:Uncharacterized protein n=1 Tax=Vespula squamosa TaxID=30214 RepID=A0ABD2AQB0_VESSQ